MYASLSPTIGASARQNKISFPTQNLMWSSRLNNPVSINSGVAIEFDAVNSEYGQLNQPVLLTGDWEIGSTTSYDGATKYIAGNPSAALGFIALLSANRFYFRCIGQVAQNFTADTGIPPVSEIIFKNISGVVHVYVNGIAQTNTFLGGDIWVDVFNSTSGGYTSGDLYDFYYKSVATGLVHFSTLNATENYLYSSNYRNDGMFITINGAVRSFGSEFGNQSFLASWNKHDIFNGIDSKVASLNPAYLLLNTDVVSINLISFSSSGLRAIYSNSFDNTNRNSIIIFQFGSTFQANFYVDGVSYDLVVPFTTGVKYELIASNFSSSGFSFTINGQQPTVGGLILNPNTTGIQYGFRSGFTFTGIMLSISDRHGVITPVESWGNSTKSGSFDSQIFTGINSDVFGKLIQRKYVSGGFNSSGINYNNVKVESTANSVVDTSGSYTIALVLSRKDIETDWVTFLSNGKCALYYQEANGFRLYTNYLVAANFAHPISTTKPEVIILQVNSVTNLAELFVGTKSEEPVKVGVTRSIGGVLAGSYPMTVTREVANSYSCNANIIDVSFYSGIGTEDLRRKYWKAVKKKL
jgi:hypothetical protein